VAPVLRGNPAGAGYSAEFPDQMTMQQDRRQYRRLDIRLPLEYFDLRDDERRALRTISSNISTSGLYFEVDLVEGAPMPQLNSVLNVSVTVPPGDGYFPYEGQVTGTAEVVRCDHLAPQRNGDPARVGVGARFRDPLKLAF
jgi:c-di-GMP-binding flagellar brake protein YcgR